MGRPVSIPSDVPSHAAPVTSVSFAPTRPLLASASYDGTVAVWSIDSSGLTLVRSYRHRRLVNAVAWNPVHPELLASGSADKTVAVWDVDAPFSGPSSVLARHTDDVNAVSWLPDGKRLVCVSEDGRSTLWDGLTGSFLGTITSHAAHCMAVDVSPQGLAATVGEDGVVAVADPDDLTGTRRTRSYGCSIEGCGWSPNGTLLAVARDDGVVDVLDRELRTTASVPVASSACRSVAWTGPASLVVGAYDGRIHFVDVAAGRVTQSLLEPRAWPRSVAASGRGVAVGSFTGEPYLVDRDGHGFVAQSERAVTHGPNALAVHDGELLVGCDSGMVLALETTADRARLRPTRVLQVSDSPVLSLAATDRGVYAGTYSGEVVRLAGGQTTRQPIGAPVPSLLATGDAVVAGTYNGELVELDALSLRELRRIAAHDGSVKSLAAAPEARLVSAATDGRVCVGSLDVRESLWEHGNLVNAVATSHDGIYLASASRDHSVKVGRLRAADGRVGPPGTLLGPDESVKCVAVLQAGGRYAVLAGSYDFRLYAWQFPDDDADVTLDAGDVVMEFAQGVSHMCAVAADTAAVASWDGVVQLVRFDGRRIVPGASLHVPTAVSRAGGRAA